MTGSWATWIGTRCRVGWLLGYTREIQEASHSRSTLPHRQRTWSEEWLVRVIELTSGTVDAVIYGGCAFRICCCPCRAIPACAGESQSHRHSVVRSRSLGSCLREETIRANTVSDKAMFAGFVTVMEGGGDEVGTPFLGRENSKCSIIARTIPEQGRCFRSLNQ